MTISRTLLLLCFFSITAHGFAADVKLSSKNKQALMIELFTSQGCSSCPPAEEYINGYANNKELWSKYIPIVFHVDYWDYIGWKDVFAKPQFTARQYRYAKLKHVRTVYTPAFIVNGRVWRKGFFNSSPSFKGLDGGLLGVHVKGDSVKASFIAKHKTNNELNLNIAIVGMDISIDITAGENDGRKAKHNFVVLEHAVGSSNNFQWKMQLPNIKNTSVKNNIKLAIVAWVSSKNDPTPIQAVGGWL